MTLAEIAERIESPELHASIIGQHYVGRLNPRHDDMGYYLAIGEYLVIIDIDRTITEIIER